MSNLSSLYLLTDFAQTSLQKHQSETRKRLTEEREREELLSRRFTTNKDTSIYIDYSVEHQRSLQVVFDSKVNPRINKSALFRDYIFNLQNANRGVDDLIHSGSSILDSIRDQGSRIKGARRRLLDIGNTLGLSNTTMKYIERRAREDKYILICGMVVTLIVITLVIIYLT